MDRVEFETLLARLDRIETALAAILTQKAVREWYTTDEAAAVLGKAEFTVREWCRNGRVNAKKKGSGRGKHQGWAIAHEELQRIQREGLLPIRR
jgi:hypothetical protein